MIDKLKTTLKNLFDKAKNFVKENKTLSIAVGSALAVVIICGLLFCSLSCGKDKADFEWGDGITEGIPEFSAGSASFSVAEDGSYVAAYYEDISIAQVDEYLNVFEQFCGVEFGGDKYPKTVVYQDKIIAIHYTVTDMQLSITVVNNEK